MPNWKKVIVSGSDAHLNSLSVDGNASITGSLNVYKSGSTVFSVQGSQGTLFEITDSLSGSLFSVSDISGIPIVEVFSDDTVKIGTHNSEAIIVSGDTAVISGSLTGSINLDNVVNAGTDTDKFLVLDADGNVDYRTGAQVLSDIGGAGSTNIQGGASEVSFFRTNTQITSSRRIHLLNTASSDAQALIVQGQVQIINDPTRNVGGSSPMQIVIGSGSTGDINNPQYDSFIALEHEDGAGTEIMGLRVNGTQATAAEFKMNGALQDAYSIGRLIEPTTANTLRIKPTLSAEGGMTITGSLTVSGSNTFRNIGPSEFTGSMGINGQVNIASSVRIPNFPYVQHISGEVLEEGTINGYMPFNGINLIDGGIGKSYGQFTVPYSGWIEKIIFHPHQSATSGDVDFQFYKNASALGSQQTGTASASGGITTTVTFGTSYTFSAGDKLSLRIDRNNPSRSRGFGITIVYRFTYEF